MKGLGVHAMMWSLKWDHENAARAIAGAAAYGQDFIEIPLVDIASVDAEHTRSLLERHDLSAVCSLVLPEPAWASVRPQAAVEHLKAALDKAAAMGAKALTGVTYGGTNERTGFPPTQGEYDNLTRALSAAATHAKALGLQFGIETVNRYESHLLNSAEQAVALVERIGADNVFIHLDTFHMNMEEKGIANGIIAARNHLKYMHMSESDRGTPGFGNVAWDEVFSALAAIRFSGVLALEGFAAMPEEMAGAISTWRPVAASAEESLAKGLAFLRDKANQYRIFE
ncbi:sugar phosphate isomerase/epimerase family protein [Agrobacterium tumefaciens]|uniref:D-tagatose 3-epimerase n=1 Tax=Agrobacterium tumefaciens TaxID=358 RepID=A0A176WVJ1_AGRTU|nr:sugar phosphate isomerase/epimerase [Agrobacterium tumefaciens]OAE36312.1 D-tagatose 3-epimerase [Agrobacterium tumefaciens]